jgi:transcriptional regulator with XRE-family HTH domain
MSQRDFVEKIGVSRNLIWYWESGRKSPNFNLSRLGCFFAMLFQYSAESFFDKVI